jgi:DNA-directed RNA polymerase subunit alpha
MQQTLQPKMIKVQQDNSTTFTISLRPLERGLGATVGEVMTRLMYDTLVGCKLSKIALILDNHIVLDPQAYLPTQETVEEILLNLQEVIFESSAPLGQQLLTIAVPMKATITAADIILDAHTCILNPEQILYHYTGNGSEVFEIQLTITKASGHFAYPTMYGRDGFYLDSCFSPVLNCTYKVLDTRVGESTDLNELLLCVTLQKNHDFQSLLTEVLENLQAQIAHFL